MIRVLSFALLLILLASCRSRGDESSALADGSAGPAQAFTDFCGKQNPSVNDINLLKLLTAKLWPGQTPSSVFATKSCAEIYARIAETKKVDIFGNFTDVGPLATLRDIPGLTVSIDISTWPKNFSALRELQVVNFTVRPSIPGFAGISDANAAEIVDVAAGYVDLRQLYLMKLGISDFAPLAPLRNVKVLSISGNTASDLSFLRSWTELEDLLAGQNRFADIAPLASVLQLKSLDLENNRIKSLDPLLQLANLEFLNLSFNPDFPDVLALQFLPNLAYLNLQGAKITDISVLKGLPIKLLTLTGSPIASIDPLKDVQSLVELNINDAKITNVDIVAGIKSLEALRIANTLVTSLPKFPKDHKLGLLDLKGTSINNPCAAISPPNLISLRMGNGAIYMKQQIKDLKATCPPP